LGRESGAAVVAQDPADVLEGGVEALEKLPAWLDAHAARYPQGAAIGFLAYELARSFERLPLVPDAMLPDLSFSFYPRLERFEQAHLAAPNPSRVPADEKSVVFDFEEYKAAVEKIRAYLVAGDIYQANLTHQFSVPLCGLTAQEVFGSLLNARPAFGAFLKAPYATIVSSSPERFFRVQGNHIEASPIKGTIARGITAENDQERIVRLLSSEKDRAENVMIVDLLRNDLGRLCSYRSIRARLWDLERLPQLFHLVSHVGGTLRRGVGLGEILRALFPCGSITGAPKIRAMEILAEVERRPRGVSMGAIGIITGSPRTGNLQMDFSVAIRTVTIRDHIAVFNVGGGIVYDSQPAAEYAEIMLKARPILQALQVPAVPEAHAWESCRQQE
jgi:para-aminobenzoate synthetase component 1